jgi:hypothetical protein
MSYRKHHTQKLAAPKAGMSRRSARDEFGADDAGAAPECVLTLDSSA